MVFTIFLIYFDNQWGQIFCVDFSFIISYHKRVKSQYKFPCSHLPSQCFPLKPIVQVHEYPCSKAVHDAPLRHGLGWQCGLTKMKRDAMHIDYRFQSNDIFIYSKLYFRIFNKSKYLYIFLFWIKLFTCETSKNKWPWVQKKKKKVNQNIINQSINQSIN